MSTFRDLRQRRFVQLLLGYLAAGWVCVEVVSQLVENGLLPGLAYRLIFLWFLGGIPGAAIFAWFHGEQGRQKAPKTEIALLTLLLLGLGLFTARTVDAHLETQRAIAGAEEGGLPPQRVAVLYLEDGSRDGELAHVADGFTEDLIDVLSTVPELDVVSANGVRPYRNVEDPDETEVAEDLRAGTLVTGSVHEAGDAVAVDLALVDGASGAVFRRASLEVPKSSFLEGGQRVAQEAAALLRERLGEELRIRETRRETENQVAWSRLQQARRTIGDAKAALEEHDAERADQMYAAADSLLAQAATIDTTWVRPVALRSEVAFERARLPEELPAGLPHTLDAIRHGESAVERDPTSAAALEARGTARYWRWLTDPGLEPSEREQLLRMAREDLERAVDRDPRRASAYATLSHLYYNDPSSQGLTTVLVTAQRAYEEDAYLESAPTVLWRIYNAAVDSGQFPPAIRACEEGRERFPQNYRFRMCRLRLMATPALAAEPEQAWRLAEEADSLAPEPVRPLYRLENRLMVAAVLERAGLADSARAVLDRTAAEADASDVDPHGALWLREAIVRHRVGQTQQALDLVRRYLAANPGHRFDEGHGLSWWWRGLQTEPDFQRMLERETEARH